MNTINSATSSTGTSAESGSAPPPAKESPIADKETFLQLLVAQIKHQDPLNPADGVQFLSQLAQFGELEQMMGIRQEVAALREQLAPDSSETDGSGSESETQS
ncbi:MAG: flagellar hook assembly protein FlgD [Bryobacteraceae bacterium]